MRQLIHKLRQLYINSLIVLGAQPTQIDLNNRYLLYKVF